jgi:small-conductance mechanosensitive channel
MLSLSSTVGTAGPAALAQGEPDPLPQDGGVVESSPWWEKAFGWMNEPLFEFGEGTKVTVVLLLVAVVIVALTYRISGLIQGLVGRGLHRAGVEDEGAVGRLQRLTHYTIVVLGFLTAMGAIGIPIESLLAAGAVFAIAFGFAMQTIAQNFVSGMILLIERSISEGDVLEIDGQIVRVREMGIRSTVVRTLDEEELIVPNASLVQDTVKNYTLRDNLFRLRAFVGVEYASDMELVRRVLEETARELEWRDRERAPRIHLREFGDNSVNWDVSVWIHNPWLAPQLLSRLNEALWFALKEKGITIAYPQRDVHLDPQVGESLRRIADGMSPVPSE